MDSPYLVLDAASPVCQVGVWQAGAFLSFEARQEAPLEGLFSLIEAVLVDTQLTFKDLAGAIYCQGPGSVLGVRLTVMALRAWEKVAELPSFTYNSLEALAAFQPGADFILAPARQRRWHLWEAGAHREVEPEALTALTGKGYVLEQRRQSPLLPQNVTPYTYHLSEKPDLFKKPGFLKNISFPETFNQTEAQYAKWQHKKP